MSTRQAQDLSYRVDKIFDRHFKRQARDVLVYTDPTKVDCTCVYISPLGGGVNQNCPLCFGKGYFSNDSSVCLQAIVASVEPRRGVTYGKIQHEPPASYHNESFIVVFKIADTILNPDRYPDRTIFEETGNPKVGWGGHLYTVKSFAADGIGSTYNYLKVVVEKTEE